MKQSKTNQQIAEKYVSGANWPKTLEKCKEFATECVYEWQWKEKAPEFIAKIDRARSIKEVQQLVIYPLLSGEGNAVLKF